MDVVGWDAQGVVSDFGNGPATDDGPVAQAKPMTRFATQEPTRAAEIAEKSSGPQCTQSAPLPASGAEEGSSAFADLLLQL